MYYLSDYVLDDGTTIYEVTLNNGIGEMTYLAETEDEVAIAYNPTDNLIYAVSKLNNTYSLVNPHIASPVFGAPISLNGDLGEITGAAFSSDGHLLISSQTTDTIYSVNTVTNVVSTYDSYSPIRGGDIAVNAADMVYLASNNFGGGLYKTNNNSGDLLIASISNMSTGLAITDSDKLLVSARNNNSLIAYNSDGTSTGQTYNLMLDGGAFTLNYGDMASGCNTYVGQEPGLCETINTFYAQYNEDETQVYSVNFSGSDANLSLITTVPFNASIAYNAVDNLIYLVSKSGSYFRAYDLSNDSFTPDVSLNQQFNSITGAFYNMIDGMLYISDVNTATISRVNPITGITSFYALADVYGGDMAMAEEGDIYMATQIGNNLVDISNSLSPVLVGTIANKATGLAQSSNSGLIMSNYLSYVFTKINTADAGLITAYNVKLDGSPFQLFYGDMAAGCADINTPPGLMMESDRTPASGADRINAYTAKSVITSLPNPTKGISQVVFSAARTSASRVEIFDMSGRSIATLFDGLAQEGLSYKLDFDGTYLPNGIYVYRLTTVNETIITKFMIAR